MTEDQINDMHLRQHALIEASKLIGQAGNTHHTDVLQAAQKYYEFLKGEAK